MAMRGGAGVIRRDLDPERRFFDAVLRNGKFQKPGDDQRFMLALTNYVHDVALSITVHRHCLAAAARC